MKRQLIAPIAALLMLGAGAATAGAESGTPEPGRMFLSWHAPYGKPGATADLTIAPGDTTEQDTLYLTCLSPVDVPRFIAMMALFTIRPATGDTLAPYWQSGHERTLTHVAVQPTPDTGKPYPVPWRKGAMNGAKYTGSAVKGNLAVVIAVGSADAESLRAGVPYVLARLIFPHPATGVESDAQFSDQSGRRDRARRPVRELELAGMRGVRSPPRGARPGSLEARPAPLNRGARRRITARVPGMPGPRAGRASRDRDATRSGTPAGGGRGAA